MAKDLSWIDAITAILEEAGDAMHYVEIANRIGERKLKINVGATPISSVSSTITTSINKKGPESPFIRVGRGVYILRSKKSELEEAAPGEGVKVKVTFDAEVVAGGIVQAFGMFWRMDKVLWKSNPRIYGQQQIASEKVNFCKQVGVYLLHDRNRVIYVGRSTDRPIGQRLYEHTKDRLNGRWDRFSWFGLKRVNENGRLEDAHFDSEVENIISVMEAVLIEGLEPPQNRKRGDSFSAIEYLQADDPELRKAEKAALLKEMLEAMPAGE